MTERFILEDQIADWVKCFNCIFAKKLRKSTYSCRLKHWINKGYLHNSNNRVDINGVCEHIITRPRFASETYGFAVIMYYPQEKGVRKLSSRMKTEYLNKVKQLMLKLKLPNYPLYNLGFGWTFQNSRDYALIRNMVTHGLYRENYNMYQNIYSGTYVCDGCNYKCNYDEVEVHHIMERTNGGSDTTANLDVLCKWCHDKESWKLASGRSEVPVVVSWKKLCAARAECWDRRLEHFNYRVKSVQESIEIFSSLYQSELSKVGKASYYKRLLEDKKELDELEKLAKTATRKIRFWNKYAKKTENWNYKSIKKPKVDLKKFRRIDEFFA